MATPTSTWTDELLFEALKQGDEKAFEQLYDRYWEKLLSAAFYRVHDLEVAKELVQDIFANLWRRRTQTHLSSSFTAYIHTAMRYSVLDHIRQLKRSEKYVIAIKESLAEETSQTHDTVAYREFANVLDAEVNKLPQRCRQVFHLSRFEACTTKEIAEHMQISPKTVENQLTKALRLLRSNLREYSPYLYLVITYPYFMPPC